MRFIHLKIYHGHSLFTHSDLEYEIIIVEDNSPDGTLAVAKQLQSIYGHDKVKILSRKGKLGLGSAYRDGLKLATGEYVFLMDADLSHHVSTRSYLTIKNSRIRIEAEIHSTIHSVRSHYRSLTRRTRKSHVQSRTQQKHNCDIVTGTRYLPGGGVRGFLRNFESTLTNSMPERSSDGTCVEKQRVAWPIF